MNNLNILLILFGLIGSVFIVLIFYVIAFLAIIRLYLFLHNRNQDKINWDLYHDYEHYYSSYAVWLPKHTKADPYFPIEPFIGL